MYGEPPQGLVVVVTGFTIARTERDQKDAWGGYYWTKVMYKRGRAKIPVWQRLGSKQGIRIRQMTTRQGFDRDRQGEPL